MEPQPTYQARNLTSTFGNANSRIRKETRNCKHPGCSVKFEGSLTSLYCLEHRSRKSRADRFIPKEPPKPEENNLVFQGKTNKPAIRSLACSLPNCHNVYTFVLYPDRNLYPMYCEEHRSEHKRNHFIRMMAKGQRPQYQASNVDQWGDSELDFEAYALEKPLLEPFSQDRKDVD